MQTAVNPQTGETVVLVGDKWQRAEQIATNQQGQKAFLVGGQWMSDQGAADMPVPKQASTRRESVMASAPYRALRGAADPLTGVAQLVARGGEAVTSLGGLLPNQVSRYFEREGKDLDAYIKSNDAEILSARQKVTGEAEPGFDWARFGGNVVSPVSAAVAAAAPIRGAMTATQLAGRGAAAGAVGAGVQPVTSGQENFWTTKAVQIGVGAAGGAVATPAITKLANAIAPRVNAMLATRAAQAKNQQATLLGADDLIVKALRETGQDINDLPAEYIKSLRGQVVDALRAGKKLDAATLMRSQDFKSLGIVPTQGQITRDATQFATERNLRGVQDVGRPLMDRFTSQNQRLGELLNPRGPREAFQAGDLLANTLRDADELMSKKVSSLYGAARQAAGKDAQVPLQGLAQDTAKVLDDFADKVPTAVRNRLASYGLLDGKQTKAYTPEEADKLLKLINDHVGSDSATNKALGQLRNAVKRTMTEGAVDDVFAPARAAAAKRFTLQDAIPALDDAASGRASPDNFVQKYIINGKAKEVQNLAELLKAQNPEAAGEARKQLAAVLQRSAFGENAAGDKIFSPERYAQTLRNIGTDKLKAFFTPAEIEQFRTIGRVGAYINSTPTAAPVSTSNSGVPVVNAALRLAPGGGNASLVAAALAPVVNSVKNTSAVNNALSNVGPVISPNINPRQAEMLARLLSGGAVGSGTLAAFPLQSSRPVGVP